MHTGRPSVTAQRVALSRAAHQAFDTPRVLEDSLALAVIGSHAAAEILARPRRFQLSFARHLRAFVVARSRLAEDALAQALTRGVRQYVVLGAGLDTFAYRNPYPASLLRVFEVDHPATQAWKRGRLAAAAIPVPPTLSFVPIDFETQTLPSALAAGGFSAAVPSFFSWLGVTMYLTPETVLSTMKYVASLPAGSGIVFDYVVPPATLTPLRRYLYRALMRRVASVGEPWKGFFEPAALLAELQALGFAETEDLGSEAINARFFHGRSDQLEVAGPARLVNARTSSGARP
jgi:methyltransferase (TIGR00027 family)